MKPTQIICVELVNANQNADGRGPERPGHQGTKDGELALVEIVDENRIKLFHEQVRVKKRRTCCDVAYPDVTVHHERDSQETVKDRVSRARRCKCCRGHGKQRRRQKAFECPVIGTVGL